jgi:hypothetical protein
VAEDFGWPVNAQNKENPDSVTCDTLSGMLRTPTVVSLCSTAICHKLTRIEQIEVVISARRSLRSVETRY